MGTLYEIKKREQEKRLAYVAWDGVTDCGYYIMTGPMAGRGEIRRTSGPYKTEKEAQEKLDKEADDKGWRYSCLNGAMA